MMPRPKASPTFTRCKKCRKRFMKKNPKQKFCGLSCSASASSLQLKPTPTQRRLHSRTIIQRPKNTETDEITHEELEDATHTYLAAGGIISVHTPSPQKVPNELGVFEEEEALNDSRLLQSLFQQQN
jgi:hypothetical protein